MLEIKMIYIFIYIYAYVDNWKLYIFELITFERKISKCEF